MEKSSLRKYITWLVAFSVLGLVLVTFVIIFNDKNENDLLYAIDSIGISLCINIVASMVIVIFFSGRDRRIIYSREKSAAQKIAADIRLYLDKLPKSPDQSKLEEIHKMVEYLRNTFHNDLSRDVTRKIDEVLRKESPSPHGLQEILDFIEDKYGKTLYRSQKDEVKS